MSAARAIEQTAGAETGLVDGPPAVRHSTFAALRHRNFRLYAGGMLVSMAGTWMQSVAQGWLVYQITQSEGALGVVAFASAIPALIVSPWAGVILDRTSKRRVLIITQAAAGLFALTLAFLTFSGRVEVWHIVLMAVGLGVVSAFDAPARQSFVVEMVGHEDLPNAIAVNSLIFNSARVIGPAIGGLVLALVGAAWCFFINGLSFIAVILALVAMRLPPLVRRVSIASPWSELKDGLTYVRRQPAIAALLMQALIFCVFGISYSTVLPAFADRVLHVGAGAYGLIMSCIGIGAVLSGLILARYTDRVRRGRLLILVALAFPLILLAFAWTTSLPVALAFAFLLGTTFLTQFVLLNTLLQTLVDNNMRGRVLSLYTLTMFGFAPFGSLAVGALSQQWGLSITITVSAFLTLVLSAFNLLRSRQIRQLQ